MDGSAIKVTFITNIDDHEKYWRQFSSAFGGSKIVLLVAGNKNGLNSNIKSFTTISLVRSADRFFLD